MKISDLKEARTPIYDVVKDRLSNLKNDWDLEPILRDISYKLIVMDGIGRYDFRVYENLDSSVLMVCYHNNSGLPVSKVRIDSKMKNGIVSFGEEELSPFDVERPFRFQLNKIHLNIALSKMIVFVRKKDEELNRFVSKMQTFRENLRAEEIWTDVEFSSIEAIYNKTFNLDSSKVRPHVYFTVTRRVINGEIELKAKCDSKVVIDWMPIDEFTTVVIDWFNRHEN
jgi:hypothetical protein